MVVVIDATAAEVTNPLGVRADMFLPVVWRQSLTSRGLRVVPHGEDIEDENADAALDGEECGPPCEVPLIAGLKPPRQAGCSDNDGVPVVDRREVMVDALLRLDPFVRVEADREGCCPRPE